MRVLAIDTTAARGSVALAEDGRVLEQAEMEAPGGFSRVLFGEIESLLARHAWTLGSVEVFAAAAGPGSFTGVRVGLAAAKGLAEATGSRALGVSNLEALASCGSRPGAVPVIDARRDEVYTVLGGRETVLPVADWLARLPADTPQFVTPDASFVRGLLAGTALAAAEVMEVSLLARAVAALAFAHPSPDAAAIDANYVRRSDAELLWRDPRA